MKIITKKSWRVFANFLSIQLKGFLGLLIPFVIASSCSESDSEETDVSAKIVYYDFDSLSTLDPDTILTDEYKARYSLDVYDSLLISEVADEPVAFRVYNKHDLRYLGGFGIVGEGPGEWSNIVKHSNQFEKDGEEIFLWFSDEPKGKFMKVNLTKTLKMGSKIPVVDTTIHINSGRYPFNVLLQLEDNRYVATPGYDDVHRVRMKFYDLYNDDSVKFTYSRLFPTIKNIEVLPGPIQYSMYSLSMRKHPEESKIVQLLRIFDRVDIFDGSLEPSVTIVGGENWENDYYDAYDIDYEGDFRAGRVAGYSVAAVTKDYIYGVVKKDRSIKPVPVSSKIRVFDWSGNSIIEFEVPNSLTSISVDEDNSYLYGIDWKNELALRYKLPKLD